MPSFGSELIVDQSYNAKLSFWARDRDRGNVDESGRVVPKRPNLDHGSVYLDFDYSSGFHNGVVGIDFGAYATSDLWNEGGSDHEFNFWNVNNPYDKRPRDGSCEDIWGSRCVKDGVAIKTAALKIKLGELFQFRAGYIQPTLATSLGTNWSFTPGVYRGFEAGASLNKFSLAIMMADNYRAPWYKRSYNFRNSENENSGSVYSTGLTYSFTNQSNIALAYGGLSQGRRKNAHLKLRHTTKSGLFISPQLYMIDDTDLYDKMAYQIALLSSLQFGDNRFRLESTYTSSDSSERRNNTGNFSYRLTEQFGGSNGSYDIWWNNRSDFNHDNEWAVFGSVEHILSDQFSFGISSAYGAGAKAQQFSELKEFAISVFSKYKFSIGPIKNASIGLHFTHFKNDSNAPNWTGYSNAFQDENDFKLIFSMPLL